MIMFLLIFFLLYGLLHLYIFLKIKFSLDPGVVKSTILIAFMLIMISAPVLVRIFETRGLFLLARVTAHTGYTWMGLAFLFISFSLILDLHSFISHTIEFISGKDLKFLVPSSRIHFIISVLIAVSVVIYGYFEARNIRTESLIIKSSAMPTRRHYNGK